MDVKLNMQSAWTRSLLSGSLALAVSVGHVSLATAGEAIASDENVSTTIFITDDAPSEPPTPPVKSPSFTPPQSAAGSVVVIEDTPAPSQDAVAIQPANAQVSATLTPAQPAIRGDLKVVANSSSQASLSVGNWAAPQQPLAQLAVVSELPQSELPASALAPSVPTAVIMLPEPIQPAAVVEDDQPGDIQIAVHAEPAAALEITPLPAEQSAEVMLVEAYKLSLEAEQVSQYTTIIDACNEALRCGVQPDQSSFARQLASWALNRRGQLQADTGEQDLANTDFQAALELNARNWRALHNRGVSFAQAGSFAEAFDDFNAVVLINPKYAKAYANRATLYVQAKDLQAAIKDYEQAIIHDDQFATAHVGLGRVCHMLGRWEDAIEHFSMAIQIDPARADVVCSRGDLHADMGNYGEALADYAQTIELDSEFAHAYRNGAWLLATCPDESYRDPENAVLGAEQALQYSYGQRHVALDTLAAALASNGQFEEAVATITVAVDLAPEDAKFTYLSRMQLYQDNQPFRTEPVGDVSQATYEATDQ